MGQNSDSEPRAVTPTASEAEVSPYSEDLPVLEWGDGTDDFYKKALTTRRYRLAYPLDHIRSPNKVDYITDWTLSVKLDKCDIRVFATCKGCPSPHRDFGLKALVDLFAKEEALSAWILSSSKWDKAEAARVRRILRFEFQEVKREKNELQTGSVGAGSGFESQDDSIESKSERYVCFLAEEYDMTEDEAAEASDIGMTELYLQVLGLCDRTVSVGNQKMLEASANSATPSMMNSLADTFAGIQISETTHSAGSGQ